MVRINNVKRMPLHPAAVDFRRYGGERAKPAGDATTEKAAHRTMQGAVTPKKGTCNKRIKSFERREQRHFYRFGKALTALPCRAVAGQSSHGARRRARKARIGADGLYGFQRAICRAAYASLYTYA
jgi:hypothetical protein